MKKFALPALLLVAFLLRCANLPSAVVDGRLFPFDSDPAYHLRKIFLLIHNFPHLPVRDPLLAFPLAAQVQWPPLFDLLCASLWVPFSWFSHEPDLFSFLLAFFIPFLGALNVLFTFLITKAFFGKKAAWISAILVAVSPAHIFISMFGRIDHHIVEPLLLLGLLLLLKNHPEPAHHKRWFAQIALLALTVIWAVLSFPLTYYAYLVYFVVACALTRTSAALWAWLGVTLLSAFFSFSNLWSGFSPWDIQVPGRFWFGFSLTCLLFFLTLKTWRSPATSRLSKIGVAGCLFGLILFLLTRTGPGFLIGILNRKDHNFLLVGENAGLFTMGPAAYAKHIFVYLTPIVLFSFSEFNKKFGRAYRERSAAQLFLLLSFAGLLIQSFLFVRFLPTFAVLASILAGESLASLDFQRLRTRAIVGLLAVASLFPLYRFTSNQWTSEIHYPSELLQTLEWIRTHTPSSTDRIWDENAKPAYGVVSRAAFGGFLTYYAERPTLDSPFDTEQTHIARRNAIALRLAQNENEAWAIAQKERVRYLLTYPSFDEYSDLEKILGRNSPPDSRSSGINGHNVRFLETRLHILGGSYAVFQNNLLIPALTHFREVYETTEERTLGGKNFPTFRVFEAVKGARVLFNHPLQTEALLELPISTSAGKHFFYRALLAAGQTAVTVPYSTDFQNDALVVTSPYRLHLKNRELNFRVRENDVAQGHVIRVNIN